MCSTGLAWTRSRSVSAPTPTANNLNRADLSSLLDRGRKADFTAPSGLTSRGWAGDTLETGANAGRADEYGKNHGLPRDRAAGPELRAGCRPHPPLPRIPGARERRGYDPAGRALHGLRHPLLSPGLPGEQPDPGLERSCLPRRLAGGGNQPALN